MAIALSCYGLILPDARAGVDKGAKTGAGAGGRPAPVPVARPARQPSRATVGSFFAVPSLTLESHREVEAWLGDVRRAYPGLMVVGTSARAATAMRDFAWRSEVVLVVGNETSGMSHAYRDLCDAVVTIPMRGTATSLNAAVATSIALYERDSARRASGGAP